MENSHLKNWQQNPEKKSGYPAIPHWQEEPKTASTLQHKVSSKNEIKLSHQQLNELTQLFKDYGQRKPGWLRRRFLIDQRRRKLLNGVLVEAGCDLQVCGTLALGNDWFYSLHTAWHLINDRALCEGHKSNEAQRSKVCE